MATGGRVYDKGGGRAKHVGRGSEPTFRGDEHPRRTTGLCPDDVPEAEKTRLLNLAVPLPDGDFEGPAARMVFTVCRGAIFAARTSDMGRTYHAYPYRGKLSASILAELGRLARDEHCVEDFERWCRNHITRHGR